MKNLSISKIKSIWAGMDNTLALQLFNLCRFVAAFFSGVVLVKMGWTTAQVEQYEILLLVFGAFTFFWISGTQNAFLSLVSKFNKDDQAIFFKSVLGFSVVLAFFSAIALYFFTAILYPKLPADWIAFLALFLFLNLPSLYLHLKFLIENKPKAIFWFGLFNFLAQFTAVFVPTAFDLGVFGVLKGLLLLAVFRFVYYLNLVGFPTQLSHRIKVFLKKWYVLSIPLSLHILLGLSPEYVDAILIEWFQEEEGAYAIYKYGARELPLLISFIASISTAALPLIVQDQKKGLLLLKTKTKRLAHFLFPLSIILVFISTFLFELAYDEAYREAAIIFNIYLLILVSRIPMPHSIITAKQDNYFLLFVAIVEFIVNVGLSVSLLPSFGLAGVAMGTVLANIAQKILLIAFVRLKYGIGLGEYTPLNPWLSYSIILILSFLLYCVYLS